MDKHNKSQKSVFEISFYLLSELTRTLLGKLKIIYYSNRRVNVYIFQDQNYDFLEYSPFLGLLLKHVL